MPRLISTASLMVAVVGEGPDRSIGLRSRSQLEDHRHLYDPANARRVARAMIAAAEAIDRGVDLGLPTLDGSASEEDVDAFITTHRPILAYFTADGRAARGRDEVDAAAAAGRTVDVCSCDQGSGCDVMRILLAGSSLD